MESKETFGPWEESVHAAEEQKKRIKSAEKSATTPASIDVDSQTGVFPGSGKNPYSTTLSSCTCSDFIHRKLPCKHIYRLAMECGLFGGSIKKGVNKNAARASRISFKDTVAALEAMSEASQKRLQHFLLDSLFHGEDTFYLFPDKNPDLFPSVFLDPVEATDEQLLTALSKPQIIRALTASGITGYRDNMRVATLRKWCVETLPQLWSVLPKAQAVIFSAKVHSNRRKLYTYLLRKYEWDAPWDGDVPVVIPFGAQYCPDEPDTFYFPDDEITDLLTEYGHNRCLNGYMPENN